MRLTSDVRQRLLDLNEGFERQTIYEAKNFREYRRYRIAGGQLLISSSGKTSWADSRFSNEYVATDEETHRFLRKYQHELITNGL